MNFEDYLTSKKIDPGKFENTDPELYNSYNRIFLQMSPNSFTAQKLFVINKIRNQFPLESLPEINKPEPPGKIKPRVVPRIKPKK